VPHIQAPEVFNAALLKFLGDRPASSATSADAAK
jgi:hypothetical protein